MKETKKMKNAFALILIIYFTSPLISTISSPLAIAHSGPNNESLCGGEVPSNVTIIKYPESGVYKNDLHCTWTISRPGETITAVVTKLDIEREATCYYDFLQIGSGPKLCKDTPTEKFTGHERLSILFKSDGFTGGRGFTLNITSKEKQGKFLNSSRMLFQSEFNGQYFPS